MNKNRCGKCGKFVRAIELPVCFECIEREADAYYEEQLDKEICPYCGVPHGVNPYTGCGL